MVKATTIGFISCTHKYICEHEAHPRNIRKIQKGKIRMRRVLIALATLFAATSVQAADLAPNLSLETEVKAWHEVDAEKNYLTINPEVEWTPNAGALTLSVGTVITAYETQTGDNFVLFDALDDGSRPNIDFGAEYDLGNGAELFGETSWDVDAKDRTELKMGVSFTF